MITDRLPFFLAEAQISLYRADVNGNPASGALWYGGFANKLRSTMDFEEVLLKASGDLYATARHVDENHVLNLAQSWILYTPTMQDWKPVRNQPYVLQLVWTAAGTPGGLGGYWLRRTYYGVTWRTLQMDSQATDQFLVDQTLRAQYYQDDSGSLALGSGSQPAAVLPSPAPGVAQSLSFFRENTLVVGEYLLGFYQWTTGVNFLGATVIADAPQVSPVVLGLEVNGVLTGQTLVIPVGTANTEVSASVNLAGSVPAGQMVRWKILSGPSPVNSADGCTVAMQVAM